MNGAIGRFRNRWTVWASAVLFTATVTGCADIVPRPTASVLGEAARTSAEAKGDSTFAAGARVEGYQRSDGTEVLLRSRAKLFGDSVRFSYSKVSLVPGSGGLAWGGSVTVDSTLAVSQAPYLLVSKANTRKTVLLCLGLGAVIAAILVSAFSESMSGGYGM